MNYIYPDLLLISKEYLTLHLQGLKCTNTLNGVNQTNLKVEKGQKSKKISKTEGSKKSWYPNVKLSKFKEA